MGDQPNLHRPNPHGRCELAVAQLGRIYESATTGLHEAALRSMNGKTLSERVRAHYPYVRLGAHAAGPSDSRESYARLVG
jgi:hypothetical protein